MHERQAIVTGVRCLSVRPSVQSVCLSRGLTRLHCEKQLNRSRSCLEWTFLGPKEHCVRRRSVSPTARGGDSMQPSPNYFGLLLVIENNNFLTAGAMWLGDAVVSVGARDSRSWVRCTPGSHCGQLPCEAWRFEQLTTVSSVSHVAVLGRLFTHRGGT